MIRLLASVVLAFTLLPTAVAQERFASVKLEDGRSLHGRVLKMNLELLEIEVDNKVLKIPASQVRSCRFKMGVDPATVGAGDEAEKKTPVSSTAAEKPADEAAPAARPTPAPGHPSLQQPAPQQPALQQTALQQPASGASPEQDQEPPAAKTEATEGSRITWQGPIPDPVVPGSAESIPVDQRNRSHWQRRIGALDRTYPWLAPAAPSQWLSLGLLLLVGCGLGVHMSVRVVGGEAVQLSRSTGLGVWYMVTGLLQVAMVPVNDLSVVLMILANTTLSLFAMCTLFGLARLNAVLALTIQLGVGLLVFGVLELVTALLGSCGVTP